jgi:hypothetical protein
VTAIDGVPVHELADFYRALWGRGNAGVTVRLGVTRQGRQQEIEVKTIDRYRYPKLDTETQGRLDLPRFSRDALGHSATVFRTAPGL